VCVGTVFVTDHTVVPAALGGDLGCGMRALRVASGGFVRDEARLARVVRALALAIPAGDSVHRAPSGALPQLLAGAPLSTSALSRLRDHKGLRHLGTLGGGNHFVELDTDAEGGLWLLVHSGSRGLGSAIFTHHARVAETEAPGRGLVALDVRGDAGRRYLGDLAFALAFARANRDALAERALEVVCDELGLEPEPPRADRVGDASALPTSIDVHHNFVAEETWAGRPLWVHRKGAVRAAEGSWGLVPGSMGTASYLVRGKGQPEAFGSCSHGAGRVLSRREARRAVRVDALERAMRKVAYPRSLRERLVEEAPCVYRDVREVLEDQDDLVTPAWRLEPVAVLKG
jgi:tRNA-splicing ligase RtcB